MAMKPIVYPNTLASIYDPNTMSATAVQHVTTTDWDKLKAYATAHMPNGLSSAIEAIVINNGYLVRLTNVPGTTYCKTFKDIADLLVAEAAKRRLSGEQPDLSNPFR